MKDKIKEFFLSDWTISEKIHNNEISYEKKNDKKEKR